MQRNRHGWLSIRGFARQGKMQDEQGRDYPSVPATREVAVCWEGRLRLAAMQATKTSGNVVLPVFSKAPSTNVHPPPPPRFSGSRNPLHPACLPFHSAPAPVIIERAPSGPRSPSATSQRGLSLFGFPVTANPAGIRPDGALPLGTAVTPSPQVPRAIS